MLERSRNVKRNLSLEVGPQTGTMADVLSRLPRPKPEDWGFGMTTCIAAVCDHWRSIVLATDQMLTFQEVTGEGLVLKIGAIHPHWAMMSSGDVTQVGPVHRAAYRLLVRKEPETLERVSKAVLDAFWEQHLARANSYLAPLGFNLSSFNENGRQRLGETLFTEHCKAVKDISVGCSFLVAGFENAMSPHIFEVSHPIEKLTYDPVNFWAIGTGAQSALDMLAFHGVTWRMELERAIYHVCEAKFMSERALGVGRKTSVLIMEAETTVDEQLKVTVRELSDELLADIRKVWLKVGAPRFPSGAGGIIKNALSDNQRMRRMGF